MRVTVARITTMLALLYLATLNAQEPDKLVTTTVPRLVRLTGVFHLKDEKIRLYDAEMQAEGRWLPIYEEMTAAIAAQVETTRRDYLKCSWLIDRQGLRVVELRPAFGMAAMLRGFVPFSSTIFGAQQFATSNGQDKPGGSEEDLRA